MPKTRLKLTNWSKGEWSPLLDGRSDVAGYYEAAFNLTNFHVLRQGGISRRVGSRYVQEVKTSALDTIVLPFEFSVDQAYVLEFGNQYIRFYKNKAPILSGGVAYEISSPYLTADLRQIHFTQSADVLFLFHPSYQQRTLSRVSDTSWSLSLYTPTPPPSFEDVTDISGGTATLTPGATTGTNILFTASVAVFLKGDVGRRILFGTARAIIKIVGASAGDPTQPNTFVRVDIIDAFPDTNPIAAGSWLLEGSPQATLDPNLKEPVGAQVGLTAGLNTFRSVDVGKFIRIYGGIIKITIFTSATVVYGEILSVLIDATASDPSAAPAGAWTLEVASWSASAGWPRTGEFFQGRLAQAGTTKQPTTFWMSASDDFYNYAGGIAADDSVEYTIAARQVNVTQWIADNRYLLLGTSGSEHKAYGSGNANAIIGGNNIPAVDRISTHGCAPIQPVVTNKQVLFVDAMRRKVFSIGYDITQDDYDAKELTDVAEHIMNLGVQLGPLGFTKRPDPRLYFATTGGSLITLTFFLQQKIVAFSRILSADNITAVCTISGGAGNPDQVWIIAQRMINGVTKRYVEVFEDNHESLSGRLWSSLQTDCAKVFANSSPQMTVSVPHLAGRNVDVVADGVYQGSFLVAANGNVNIPTAKTVWEVGLHYESDYTSMKAALPGGQVIDGMPRSWDAIFADLKDTAGGELQFVDLAYDPLPAGAIALFTGEKKVNIAPNVDTAGRLELRQTKPYPMTAVALYGTLTVADSD